MTTFVVDTVPAYAEEVIREYAALSQDCCYGYNILCDTLERSDPKIKHRCGLIGGRYEVYALPIPECGERHMIITVDLNDRTMPRYVHGTVPSADLGFNTGGHIAIRQLGYDQGPWEI